MKIVIISLNKKVYNKKFLKNLKKKFKKNEFVLINNINLKEIKRKLKNADALINCPYYIFEDLKISLYPKLKWIHSGAAGIDKFMTKDFKKSKIILTNGKILQGIEIADHAIGLLLAFSRNIYQHIKKINPKKISRPIELNKKNCAIVGLGGIGLCIAERLKIFGMSVDGYNNELIPLVSFINNFYSLKDLYSNINSYDVVINALPLTSKTKNFFDTKIFNKMKKNSIFINVSRGQVVNHSSLENKKLLKKFKGIGLDVTDPEPLPKKSILNKSDNVILTHHTAGHSDQNRNRSKKLVTDNIEKFLMRDTLLNTVDKSKEY